MREPSARYLTTPLKMTEVGVIPVDWEAEQLGDLCSIRAGGDVDRGLLSSHEGPTHPYPIWANAKSPVPYGYSSKYQCPAESLTVTARGDIGHAVYRDRPYCAVGRLLSLVPTSRVSARFIAEFINARVVFASESTGVPQLTGPQIAKYSIAVPSSADETHRIANALCAADALIDSLEQLLTKKRQIKQGAMQELLTGKRRLPGFNGEWADCTLLQLADIRSGGTPSTSQADFWDGGIPWCTPTDITALAGAKHIAETERSISEKGQKASSAEMLPVGTVVMTSRATIGECAIAAVPITTNQGFKNFIPRSTTCGDFLYYLLGTQRSAFLALCSGSTFLEIGKRQLAEFSVRCPIEYDEQRAIADVLSSIDAEIVALESRLTKARALKQAMAQALLTGRIRLVESTA